LRQIGTTGIRAEGADLLAVVPHADRKNNVVYRTFVDDLWSSQTSPDMGFALSQKNHQRGSSANSEPKFRIRIIRS
jgi:hypothetical protein